MLRLYEEEDENDVGKYYEEMIQYLMVKLKALKSKGVVINAANSIFADKAFPLSSEYEKVVTKYYRVAPKQVDFGGDPEGAKTTINTFVADVTQNMIPNLLDSVATDTKAIIVNAVYFKGVWKNQFKEKKTKEMDFHVDANTKVKVQMMHQKKSFRYARLEGGAAALEIPYKGEETAMIFILPDKGKDLESIERKVRMKYHHASWKNASMHFDSRSTSSTVHGFLQAGQCIFLSFFSTQVTGCMYRSSFKVH